MFKFDLTVRSLIIQTSCLWTFTKYILLAVIFSVEKSDEMSYKVEFDRNTVSSCKHGFMDKKDTIRMMITMYTKDGEVNDDTLFKLEAVDPKTNHSLMICELQLRFACLIKNNQGCLCASIAGFTTYNYEYLSMANSLYSQNLIKINGNLIKNVAFPKLFEEDYKVLVILRVNGVKMDDATSNCTAQVHTDSVVVFKFCTTGLTQPKLKVNFLGSLVESSDGRPCLKAEFTTGSMNSTEMVSFSYNDTCFVGEYNCTVQVSVGPPTTTVLTTRTVKTTTAQNTYTTGHDDLLNKDPTNLEKTFVLIGVLVTLLCATVLVYWKLIHKRQQRNTEVSASTRSTVMDPLPPPSPSISKTASLAKRLTLVFSPAPKPSATTTTTFTPKTFEYETEV